MRNAILTRLVVSGIALLIAMPALTFAEPHPRAGSRIKRHSPRSAGQFRHQKRDRRPDRQKGHRWHRSDRRPDRQKGHRWHRSDRRRRHHPRDRHHKRHHHRRYRRHGVHVDVNIGGHGRHPVYPHGHRHHIHDDYCPIVIRPVIIAPVWDVYYHSHHRPSASAMLHVVIGPFSGALYIDDEYYGETHEFRDGRLELPVAPGLHTVQLRYGGSRYSYHVRARHGATAVVTAGHNM
jgi:hypothetical protein